MFTSTDEPTRSQFCLVYDKESGKVVHIHELVLAEPSSACSRETLAAQALQLAPTKYERNRLAVFHPEEGQALSRQFKYRIDGQRQALIVEKSGEESASALNTGRRQ